ncbi:MAG: protein kinase [Polyangiaceae bacterium]|nr:protein kinase [Polyangiaceae bacterium]
MREFAEGQIVGGTRYRVRGQLGAGGMGSVYEVEHLELGKRFVLKALFRELSARKDLVARLRQEWRALGQLDHPNIINVTDAGTTPEGVPFYVMERLDGETLGERLRRVGRLEVTEAVSIATGILQGIAAAHRIGIVHRDIKPPNIFLPLAGGVKVLDFGIAKLVTTSVDVITGRGMAIGTPRYMSPEQARGDSVDGRADLYAIGLTLYEMLVGGGPFDFTQDPAELLLAHLTRDPPTVASQRADAGSPLSDIVALLLQKDPAARPATAEHVIALLDGLVSRWRAVSTDAPTPDAKYGVPTLRQVSPSVSPPGTQPVTPAAGASPSAPVVATAVLDTPTAPRRTASGSTLIIGPGGELTGSVQTVRDGEPDFPSSVPSAAPGDRTLADAEPGPASLAPAESTRLSPRGLADTRLSADHTEALSARAEALPAPAPFAEAPTRTAVPLEPVASQPATPPPVTAEAPAAPSRAPGWLVLGLAAAGLLAVALVVVGVLGARRLAPPAPGAAAPAGELAAPAPPEVAAGEPDPPPEPEPAAQPEPEAPATPERKPAAKAALPQTKRGLAAPEPVVAKTAPAAPAPPAPEPAPAPAVTATPKPKGKPAALPGSGL